MKNAPKLIFLQIFENFRKNCLFAKKSMAKFSTQLALSLRAQKKMKNKKAEFFLVPIWRNNLYFFSPQKLEKRAHYSRRVGVVAISLWSDALEKSFEKLYSLVFSPGKCFETSRHQKFLKVQKFIQHLQGKTLRNLEKQRLLEIHRSSKKVFVHSRESALNRFISL